MGSDRYDSDAELVEGLRHGEDAAAAAFVREYLPLIRAGIRRYMSVDSDQHEPGDLDDEASELMTRLIRRIAGPRPISNLRAFVAKAARNAGIDWSRRSKEEQQRHSTTDAADVHPDRIHIDAQSTTSATDAEYESINPGAVKVMEQACSVLNQWERDLLSLHAAGYSYREIADILQNDTPEVSESAWRKRRERAEEKLLAECQKLAASNPETKQALEEGQRLLREQKATRDANEMS